MRSFGILTYFNYYNYGSMLQGYATQYALQSFLELEDRCELIDYRYISPLDKSFRKKLVLRISHIFEYISRLREVLTKRRFSERMKRRNELFDRFKNEFTKLSPQQYHNKQDLIVNTPDYDVYVIGSDQTWSPKVSGGYAVSPMLLDYVDNRKLKCAYAPSLGTDKISEKDSEILKKQLACFQILTCREEKGAYILSNILGREVKKVLDPTLILTGDDWRKIAVNPGMQSKSYILCYFLGDQDYYRHFAKRLSEQTGLPLYYIPVSWKDCRAGNNLIFNAGPREFIGWVDNAYAVLTDSFHGVAFSTNLNKDFYAFTKHKGGVSSGDNSRLYDFLRSYNLESRLFETYDDDDIYIKSIDYSIINAILQEDRDKSLEIISHIAQIKQNHD